MTQLKSLLAALLVGDGTTALVIPSRHSARFTGGPEAYRRVARVFVRRPNLTRALAALEVALGLWWTTRLPPHSR